MSLKIGGVEVTGPNEGLLILPRPMGRDIKILVRAVPNLDEFRALVPYPKAPASLQRGKGKVENTNDPTYRQQVEQYNLKRMAYLAVIGLEPSEIEWKKVEIEKPNTWIEWEDELLAGGVTEIEVNLILNLVLEVNQLNDAKLTAARESFVLGQQLEELSELLSRPTEPANTQSGEPVQE
jgi:hypothetical protein